MTPPSVLSSLHQPGGKRRGAGALLLVVTFSLAQPLAWAQVMVPPSSTDGSTINTQDDSTRTITSVTTNPPAGLPVVVQVAAGYHLDVTSLTGAVIVDGIPTTGPSVNGAVVYQSNGVVATSPQDGATQRPGGNITVQADAAITATGVMGSNAGSGGLLVLSLGADGYDTGGQELPPADYDAQAFYGTAGGEINLTLGGAISVTGVGSGGARSFLVPTLTGLSALSVGGNGSSGFYDSGGVEHTPVAFIGNGGGAGGMEITTTESSSIVVSQSGPGSNAAGIFASVQGGNAGKFIDSPTLGVGAGGTPGTLSIYHAGSITVNAEAGFGILATSTGGNGNDTDIPPTNFGGGRPGNGGGVTVETGGATIEMTQGGVGIFALSQAGNWNPWDDTYLPSGGQVEVMVDGGSIEIGLGTNPFSFGILAISAGNPLVTGADFLDNLTGSGVAGNVVVTNGGSITTQGELAIGIVALGIGGTPAIGTATSGLGTLGNTGTITGAGGSDLSVFNTGSIITLGLSANGMVAISSGGGGILKNDAPATLSGGIWASGISLGANTDSSAPATDGGAVSVTNAGILTTGDGLGNGTASLGIIAQSIGGSGGTVGGVENLRNVGDTGGGGGSAGRVTVTLNAGSAITTWDKNSNAVLIQSIGGGGGNGANASGGFVAVGGTGGVGGSGNVASFLTSGTGFINTYGNYSAGAVIQSIGGGGGTGGFADSDGAFMSNAIGGTGGGGGEGGLASGTHNAGATIATRGNQSAGMIVQSIGGGGGIGGAASSFSAGFIFSISNAVGGAGGDGGSGQGATGVNLGTIITGVAPNTFSNSTLVAHTGVLYGTLPDGTYLGSIAIESGSIASGVFSGTLGEVALSNGEVMENTTISGMTLSGTVNGVPTTVTLQWGGIVGAQVANASSDLLNGLFVNGKVVTEFGGPNPNGADSAGMIVQSIGGGGGLGGSATAKSLVLPLPSPGLPVHPPTIAYAVAIGGTGGLGGGGGSVTAGNLNTITTYGDASYGMVAQSLGGGGGIGGAGSASSQAIEGPGATVMLAIGGGGAAGVGGTGGAVTAYNGSSSDSGALFTYGQNAAGIVAQSIGGGGGLGGSGNAGTSSPYLHNPTGDAFAISHAIGGSAGAAGSGGSVAVNNAQGSAIATFGSASQGILAQSIGGGGGAGGGGSSSGNDDKLSLDVTVGGAGTNGGSGGAVTVENDGLIYTAGGDSVGIVAQSIGGGGGAGGTSDAGATATPSVVDQVNDATQIIQKWITMAGGSYGAELSVGGDGGAGGDGGSVVISNRGGSTAGSGNPQTWTPGILTAGSRAYGVLAQSIGGGGGTGGTATSSSRSATNVFGVNPNPGTQQYTASIKMGGDNGVGGSGSYATVTNYGVIGTLGYGAAAMLVQGIGGGGGNGADGSVDTDVEISLGRTGSTSGLDTHTGGGLTANNDPNAGLFTAGRDAPAILAQSIGGGGGVAGSGVDEFETIGGGLAGTVKHTLSLGQNVSTPINDAGGMVTVNHQGAIQTYGDWSHGVGAQSIGAGGGKASAYATDSVTPDLDITLGAENGNGDGGTVNINLLSGSWIVTGGTASGYSAYGVLAQSIGGGGGLAADLSDGSTAASGTIQVGNQGEGDGGAVTLSGTSRVATGGDAAHAVVLQSIGGGGGVAGSGSTLTTESPAPTGGVEVNVSNGGIGDGGTASIASAMLNLSTSGANAYGVLAQSIGGGGGLGFAQNAAGGGIVSDNFLVSTPSNGGLVSLVFAAGSQIVTQGAGAHAIVAQSIGGGGGIANYSSGTPMLTVGSEGASNGVGDGGVVQITSNGTIYTSGAGAYGILAQSIGGGGGLIGGNGSLYAGTTTGTPSDPSWGGQVEIIQYGAITTPGINSVGIFAQSRGTWFADEIYIAVNGSVNGGSGDQGYGIWVDGGNFTNQLMIEQGGFVSAASGGAIHYTGSGALDVMNFGEVAGSVSVGSGTFYNEGTYSPGSTVAAPPPPSLFTTAMFASSTPSVNPVNVDGNYIQTRKGTLLLNFTSAKERDYFHASGTALFQGKLRLNLPRGFTASVLGSHTLLEADGGLTARFSKLESSIPSLSLRLKGGDIVVKQDFTNLPGVRYTPNQKAVAQHLDQRAQHHLKGTFLDLLTELHNLSTEPEAVADAFSQLSPEAFSQFVRTTSFNNATFFTQQLGSYTRRARSFEFLGSRGGVDVSGLRIQDSGTPSLLSQVENRLAGWNPLPVAEGGAQSPASVQGWNAFLQGNVILAQGFSRPGIAHADVTTGSIQLGADYRLAPGLILGAYLGYDHTEATLDPRGSSGKMETYRTGLYAAYSNSGWYANALAGWGWKSLTSDRRFSFGQYESVAHGEPNGNEWLANLDGGYDFRAGGWTFGPTVGLQFTRFTVDRYTETGAPGAALTVEGQEGDSLRSRLGARASYTFRREAFALTPYLDVSWQHDFLDESEAITSQFISTREGSFTVQTPGPSRDSILIGAGLAAELSSRIAIFADYWAQAGQADYFGQTIMAGVKLRF